MGIKGGGGAPAAPEISTVESPFKNTGAYRVRVGGFSQGDAWNKRGRQYIGSNLSGALMPAYRQSLAGINNNQSFLNQSPDQQYQNMLDGKNAYYNTQKAALDRQFDQTLGSTINRLARTGFSNSTTAGGALATAANDANLRTMATQNAALDYMNNRATQNLTANRGMLQDLYNYQTNPMTLANNNFWQGIGYNMQADLANVQAKNTANQLAWQQQIQQQQQKGSTLGSLLGTGLGLAANFIPGIGPAVSAGIGAATGALGSAIGGGGSASVPYGPSIADMDVSLSGPGSFV